MARRRTEQPVDMGTVLRRELVAKVRDLAGRHRDRIELDDDASTASSGAVDGASYVCPWPRLLVQLEAGDIVTVPAWLLPRWSYEPPPAGQVSVDAAGTVEAV